MNRPEPGGAPTIPAYHTDDGTQLKVQCDYCRSWHHHGAAGGSTRRYRKARFSTGLTA